MTDLVSWLREQLDADERVAREATGDPWRPHERYPQGVYAMFEGRTPALVAEARRCGPDVSMEQIKAHIIRWDPARVLAEVDAKRQIITYGLSFLRSTDSDPLTTGCANAYRMVIKHLALPLADREGYRDEWKP